MKTQDKRLLDYLIENESIDPLTAWTELGIYRLAACIHRLRKKDLRILTRKKAVRNTFNEKCVVADYILL
jgi:hypothetical protein